MSKEEVKYGPGKCMKLSALLDNFENPTKFYDYDCLYCCKKLPPIPYGYVQWPYVDQLKGEDKCDWRKKHFHFKCWKSKDRIYPTNELRTFYYIDYNYVQELLKDIDSELTS